MPKQIYKWAAWMDGELHTLQRGTDFKKEPDAFAKSARTYARRFGQKAVTRIIGDTVFLQFLKIEEDEK
ncbi:hypothetical protein AB0H18_20615 [Streptomyces sp. NPDC020766]|uniref:hypothetical protein n=1 Tax=Streptomyces sp. NPDC020766 TaxID=3155011 RepID=UPI0033C9CA20